MNGKGIEPERFELLRQRFAELGAELSDPQLLVLADTYHEILRLRRHRRSWSNRFEKLQAAPRAMSGA